MSSQGFIEGPCGKFDSFGRGRVTVGINDIE